MISSPLHGNNNNNSGYATPKGKGGATTTTTLLRSPNNSLSSPNSRSGSAALSSPTHRRDVVVVNPTAFGKYIPSQVTMETAKLVAQVANIASEDWARLYEFHHVMWPTPTKPPNQQGVNNNNISNRNSNNLSTPNGSPKTEDLSSSYNTMDSLSRAAVQDLLAEHKSSLLISVGHESSCFGTSLNPPSERSSSNGGSTSTSIGVWPKILNQCAAMLDTKGIGECYTSYLVLCCVVLQNGRMINWK